MLCRFLGGGIGNEIPPSLQGKGMGLYLVGIRVLYEGSSRSVGEGTKGVITTRCRAKMALNGGTPLLRDTTNIVPLLFIFSLG